jgi:hypothetical protein
VKKQGYVLALYDNGAHRSSSTLLVPVMLLLLLLNGAVGTGMVGSSDGTTDVFVRGALPWLFLTEDDVAFFFFAYCGT